MKASRWLRVILILSLTVMFTGCTEKSKSATTFNSSDKKISITKAGTYTLKGTFTKQVSIEVGKKEKVELILDNAKLTCSEGPAIYIKEADRVTINLKAGTDNSVKDEEGYTITDNKKGAAIYSKADLTFKGTGKLVVSGKNNDGIVSKDSLMIKNGTYQIDAVGDGIYGKDELVVKKGNFTIAASKDGMKSAELLEIQDGKIDITKSEEGFEGKKIQIDSGVITIVASDDGINATSGDSSTEDNADGGFGGFGGGNPMDADDGSSLTIAGGSITVDARGDGIDVNGSFLQSGGELYVSGPTNGGNGALDYNAGYTFKGGILVAAGSTGMEQAISETGNGNGIQLTLDSTVQAGQMICLKDAEGNQILSYSPTKEFQSVILASDSLQKDKEYTVTVGEDITITFTLQDELTYLDNQGITEAPAGGMWHGGGRGQGGGFKGQKPEGDWQPGNGDMPDDMPGDMQQNSKS